MKVKGHVRSICMIALKCKILFICIHLRTNYNHETPTGVGSRSGVNLHHPQTEMASDTSGPGTTKYLFAKL